MAYTTIDDPTAYFQVKLYNGSGSIQSITFDGNTNMQPDFIWCKSRNNVRHHYLADVIRGVKSRLRSDADNAEYTANSTSGFDSFDSNGFTLEEDSSSLGLNESGHTMVSWNWKAGGSASSNSDGSITSSVSANTTAGFSIVSYTGTGSNATVGHGLGSALDFIIVKRRNGTMSWCTTGTANGWDKSLFLDTTDQNGSYTFWQSTAPTSSVFSIDGSSAVNGSSDTFIAYCFAEKKGYSKFGSYTGNSNVDGSFIYLGFKPAFVLAKVSSDTNDWFMFDNKRSTFNAVDDSLFPNKTDAESTSHVIDFLSNGFKIRDSDGTVNSTGNTYIYMAFAENPFVTSGGIPCTAR